MANFTWSTGSKRSSEGVGPAPEVPTMDEEGLSTSPRPTLEEAIDDDQGPRAQLGLR
jgi:hypothetical protein